MYLNDDIYVGEKTRKLIICVKKNAHREFPKQIKLASIQKMGPKNLSFFFYF